MNLANKVVLVTGGSGFLGRRVVFELRAKGALVVAPTMENCDLLNTADIYNMMYLHRPDVVIHLAGKVGGVAANIEEPATFFSENLIMGVNMLEASRRYGVEKFVQMGSACEYPVNAPIPLKEESVWNGRPEETNAAYGIAKRALLEMGQAYRKQYGMNVIHLLSTNLYGPGDNFDLDRSHVVAALIRKFATALEYNSASVGIWGDGSATRDFLYVQDAADGIILATEKYDSADPVNLGSGREISIKELAHKIAYLMGFKNIIRFDTNKPAGQPRRVLDTTRAAMFGFEAQTLLERGLLDTIEWYRTGGYKLCGK